MANAVQSVGTGAIDKKNINSFDSTSQTQSGKNKQANTSAKPNDTESVNSQSRVDAPANANSMSKPQAGGKLMRPGEGAKLMEDVPPGLDASKLKGLAKQNGIRSSDASGAKQAIAAQRKGDETSGTVAMEQEQASALLGNSRAAEDSSSATLDQNPSGKQSLRESLAPRIEGLRDTARMNAKRNGETFDAKVFNEKVEKNIEKYGDAIDRVNSDKVETIGDVRRATRGVETVEKRSDLRADDGTPLLGAAGKDGILLDSSLNDNPNDLRAVATEEIAERFFQETVGGTSEGDFGAEVVARVTGTASTQQVDRLRKADDLATVDGKKLEAKHRDPGQNAIGAFTVGSFALSSTGTLIGGGLGLSPAVSFGGAAGLIGGGIIGFAAAVGASVGAYYVTKALNDTEADKVSWNAFKAGLRKPYANDLSNWVDDDVQNFRGQAGKGRKGFEIKGYNTKDFKNALRYAGIPQKTANKVSGVSVGFGRRARRDYNRAYVSGNLAREIFKFVNSHDSKEHVNPLKGVRFR